VEPKILRVAVDSPLDFPLDYRWSDTEQAPKIGQLVLVPFGRREVVGVVVGLPAQTELPVEKSRTPLPCDQA